MQQTDRIQDLKHLFDSRPFTMIQFNVALTSTKPNKQPGPDLVMTELFSRMNADNRRWFLNLLNSWWSNQVAPNYVFCTRVVPFYKKGDTDEPSVSLLNSFHKLCMIVIRQGLQVVLENNITQTQYGFRPSRSTSRALLLTRHIQDIAEQQVSNRVIKGF